MLKSWYKPTVTRNIMSTDLKAESEIDEVNEIDPLSRYNEPIGVGFTEEGVEVWQNDIKIVGFPIKGVMCVKISHRGEFVAVLTHMKMIMYEVRTGFMSWEETNGVQAGMESGHNMQFSGDDTKIMLSSYHMDTHDVRDTSAVVVEIFNVLNGDTAANPSIRACSLFANKFSFDLNSYLLSSGVNIGEDDEGEDGAEENPGVLIHDFSFVDLEKRDDDDELEDGVSVNRHFDSQWDEHGYVVRLIARHVNDECIMVLCVRTNGVTMYMFNTKTRKETPVASLYREEPDVIVNAGISSDFSLIAILIEAPSQITVISFYDVANMKNNFRPDSHEETDWNGEDDRIIDIELPDEINIVANSHIDPELFVSSQHRSVTIYCANTITSIFIDERFYFKNLNGFCVSFSEPGNWFTDQIKENMKLALCMGHHHRLGHGSGIRHLDEELARMIYGIIVDAHKK